MPKYLTQKEAFMKCKKMGNFLVVDDCTLGEFVSAPPAIPN